MAKPPVSEKAELASATIRHTRYVSSLGAMYLHRVRAAWDRVRTCAGGRAGAAEGGRGAAQAMIGVCWVVCVSERG